MMNQFNKLFDRYENSTIGFKNLKWIDEKLAGLAPIFQSTFIYSPCAMGFDTVDKED